MKVREIMSTGVAKATPDNTLVDIAAMMRDKDIGSLPVVENGELKGIVTDRDIVVRAIAEGQDPSTATVQEVLSEDLESVQADDDVKQAADLMASRQIRRLAVLERRRIGRYGLSRPRPDSCSRNVPLLSPPQVRAGQVAPPRPGERAKRLHKAHGSW